MADKRLNIKIGIDSSGTKEGLSGIRKGLNLVGSAMKAVFRTAVVAGFFALMRVGVGIFNSFKNTVTSLGSEFLKLRLKATETAAIISKGGAGFTEAFEGALQMSRNLSNQLGYSAFEIQEGLTTAARSGLGLQESLKVTGSALILARNNGEEFQTTLNDLIGTTRAFGVELEAIPEFADALTGAVATSNVTLRGLFEGMKNVASVASTAFGESKETIIDTTAALMTLNDAGIQGAKAGTRLRAAEQKLLGGTAKTTAVFTKYGANIFQANAESQKYFKTLTNGQRAMADSEEKLNKLKNKQFELVIAGRENSETYRELQNEINGVTAKLATLEEGTDNVFTQFTLAGGKIKPLSDTLAEIKKNVPTEVIGRAFGIRGGEAIMRLLNDMDKFVKYKDSITQIMQESEEGVSISQKMYEKFMQTILVSWGKIKNTAMNTWSIIADGLFEAIKPILPKIQSILSTIFDAVSRNKDTFKEIFVAALTPLGEMFDKLGEFIGLWSKALDSLSGTQEMTVPTFTYNRDTKQLDIGEQKVEGSMGKKIQALVKSLGQAFNATLDSILDKLQPQILALSKIFAEGLAAVMQGKVTLWNNVGTYIAAGILKGLGLGAKQALEKQQLTDKQKDQYGITATPTGISGGYYAPQGSTDYLKQTKAIDINALTQNLTGMDLTQPFHNQPSKDTTPSADVQQVKDISNKILSKDELLAQSLRELGTATNSDTLNAAAIASINEARKGTTLAEETANLILEASKAHTANEGVINNKAIEALNLARENSRRLSQR